MRTYCPQIPHVPKYRLLLAVLSAALIAFTAFIAYVPGQSPSVGTTTASWNDARSVGTTLSSCSLMTGQNLINEATMDEWRIQESDDAGARHWDHTGDSIRLTGAARATLERPECLDLNQDYVLRAVYSGYPGMQEGWASGLSTFRLTETRGHAETIARIFAQTPGEMVEQTSEVFNPSAQGGGSYVRIALGERYNDYVSESSPIIYHWLSIEEVP